MGTDLREQFLSPRRLFELADAITGEPISQLCADGPLERLTRTDFDTIIGPEFVRGGSQICVRNPKIAAAIERRLKLHR